MMSWRSALGPHGGAELDLEESVSGNSRIVAVKGDVDLSTSERFGAVLKRLAGEPGDGIVVDLTNCAFIDSSGLAAIVHAASRRDGFRIVGGHGPPSEVLQMTAIDQTIPVHDTLDEALSAARSRS
jgi:anti-sigma B factor antagonist